MILEISSALIFMSLSTGLGLQGPGLRAVLVREAADASCLAQPCFLRPGP
jgi:hypothetical protein